MSTVTYQVQNRWGGADRPWHEGGKWVIGGRADQAVVAIDVTTTDGGRTLTGTMTYAGEGPIGFRGTLRGSNNYAVENQWGGDDAPWHPGGTFVLGYRSGQNVVAINIESSSGGKTFAGTMTYAGEGPIDFTATRVEGAAITVENQWGGHAAPWHVGGTWAIGCRDAQGVVALDIASTDGGETLSGEMTYDREGPIGFTAARQGLNNYAVQNRWGDDPTWHPGGLWIIGYRTGQNVVAVKATSSDGGKTLNGTMTYVGEGPIGLKAASATTAAAALV